MDTPLHAPTCLACGPRHNARVSPARRILALLPFAFCLLPAGAADIGAVKDAVAGTNGFRPLVAADRTALPLLAPASREGEARIKQFKLLPGMKVELWAAEPMLANPVAFSVDELGRVWTSETYRYRSSVLDIRHYMFMLEDDLASRDLDDRLKQIRKWFGPEGEKALSQETEVIRMLEDTDHDGKADRSTVIADSFTSPLSGIASGVLARNGEVWFTEIPSLWKFSPQGSGQLDKPVSVAAAANPAARLASSPRMHTNYTAEALLTGFGIRFSFTGHDLHGLKFGPDGRLYFSCGDRGTHVVTKEGNVIDLPDEGAVFRCEPDGSKMEVFARGLRNPQELAFDEHGDLFTGDNDSDQGDRERWEQVVEGGDYGWRVGYQHAPLGNAGPWNMERLWVPHFEGQAAYILPPIANIADGPSGLVHNYGTGLPASLDHRFLLADFKGTSSKSGIYSLLNRPKGAGFELVAHDPFLWNTLVPDVDIGPDGAVWFADWHEGWPKSNKGRIYRAYFPEAIADPVVKETAKLLAEGMEKRPDDELFRLLAHRDMRVRQEAQFELAARGPKMFPGLEKVAADPASPLARIHAIWALAQVGRRTTEPVAPILLRLRNDPDVEVRVQVARALGDIGPGDAQTSLAGILLSDASPRVRASAALSLAKLAPSFRYRRGIAADVLQRSLREDATDPVLRHAYAMAVASSYPDKVSDQFPTHRAGIARIVTLLAYRLRADTNVARFLADPDPLLVLEAARAINDVPITNALPTLAALAEPAQLDALLKQFAGLGRAAVPRGPDQNGPRSSAALPVAIRDVRDDQPLPWGDLPVDQLTPMLLRVVNANFRLGTPEAARRLAALTTRTDLSDLVRTEALHGLATWAKPHPRDRIVGTYRPLPERDGAPAREALRPKLAELLAKSPETIRVVAAEAIAQLGLASAAPQLSALVRDSAAPANARAAALRAFTQLGTRNPELGTLLAFAAKDSAEPLRLTASKLNAELDPDDAAGQLTAKLASGSLAEQQSAFTSLGDLKSDAADAILAEWLDKLMKREVANEVMLDLVEAAAKRSAVAVKSRLEAYARWKLPQDHLTPYRETLSGGDAARGKKIFYENVAAACTRCHHLGTDGGGNAGPVLDGIASRQTLEYLLESIVSPNQQIVQGFESATLTLKNGANHAGVVKSETDAEITLLSPEDGDVKVKKSDIATREKGLSGMPEGLVQLLTRQELRDLVEFLGTLK